MKRRFFILVSALCFVMTIAIAMVHPQTASADAQSDIQSLGSFHFIDQADIAATPLGSTQQIVFNDNDILNDSIHNYAPLSLPTGMCNPASQWRVGITLGTDPSGTQTVNWSASTVPAHLSLGYLVNTKCHGIEESITIPTAGSETTLQWDGNNITTLANQKPQIVMQPASTPNNLYEETQSGCGGRGVVLLDTGSGATTSGTY